MCRVVAVGPVGIVGSYQPGHIDQQFGRGGFTRKGVKGHRIWEFMNTKQIHLPETEGFGYAKLHQDNKIPKGTGGVFYKDLRGIQMGRVNRQTEKKPLRSAIPTS